MMNTMKFFKNELQLYQRSKDFLWTDPYISKQMLKHHLDLSTHAASRNKDAIEATIQYLQDWLPQGSHIVDLGCGPGLYAERLHALGYRVTGVDISSGSIAYAKSSVENQGLSIDYHQLDYLTDKLPGTYDAAICIYADFGALIPSEQEAFLSKVAESLSEGGLLVFDVFTEEYNEDQSEERTWNYVTDAGFWTSEKHLHLYESVYFPEAITWGTRDIIMTSSEDKEFITWDTLFDEDRILSLLERNGYMLESSDRNVLSDPNVMFVRARCN